MNNPNEIVRLQITNCPNVITAKVKTWHEQKEFIKQIEEIKKLPTDIEATDAVIKLLVEHVETFDGQPATAQHFEQMTNWQWVWDTVAALRFGLTVEDKKKSASQP